jgi:hypothetical protein
VGDYCARIDDASGRSSQRCLWDLKAEMMRNKASGTGTASGDASSTDDTNNNSNNNNNDDDDDDIDVSDCRCPWCFRDPRSPGNSASMTAQLAVARGLRWRRQRILQVDSTLAVGLNTHVSSRNTHFLVVTRRRASHEDTTAAAAVKGSKSKSGVSTKVKSGAASASEPAASLPKTRSRRDDYSMDSAPADDADLRSSRVRISIPEIDDADEASAPVSGGPSQGSMPKRVKPKVSDLRRLVLEYLHDADDVAAAFSSSHGKARDQADAGRALGRRGSVAGRTEVTVTVTAPRGRRGLTSDAFL